MKKIIYISLLFSYLFIFPVPSHSAGKCGDTDTLKNAASIIRSNPKKAISVYRSAVNKCPDNANLRYNLGLAYYAAGEKKKAVRQLEKVITNAPKAKDALNTLAWILIDENIDIKKGIKLAQKGIKISSTPALMDTLGWGYYQAGEMEKAEKWLKKALNRADYKHAKIIKQHLEIAQNPKHLPDLAAAFKFVSKHSGNFLEAGETAELAITIENKGEGTAYEVGGTINQDNTQVYLGKRSSFAAVNFKLGSIRSKKKEIVTVKISANLIAEDGLSTIRRCS